ncbi:hypothetical protein [Arthrobacter cavernae]|nr:hypothetical protein [Arthrobacter cavernae]
METMHSTATALPQGSGETGRLPEATAAPAAFKVRSGRCAIALAGLGFLLTAAVSGVLRIFGLGSAALPIASLLGTFGVVVLLRQLALRDRRVKRAARAARAAAPPAKPVTEQADEAVEPPATEVFDAEAGRREGARLSAVELRQAALAVAVAAGDDSVRSSPDAKSGSWKPVDVPKPTYVAAAKAPRPAPEPLDLPAAPKPLGKPSLKQGTAEQAVATAATQAQATAKGQSALGNLDDVLQRRRA